MKTAIISAKTFLNRWLVVNDLNEEIPDMWKGKTFLCLSGKNIKN